MNVMCTTDIYNFKKNKYYEVFIEYNDSYWIFASDRVDVVKFYKVKSKYINDVTFERYFVDIQKLRKEKINKLNQR